MNEGVPIMRIPAFIIVSALVASSAWARLGETAEQAEQRYGPPTLRRYGAPAVTTNEITHIVTRHYSKGDIEIYADFFTNKSGICVIGEIAYEPNSYNLPDAVLQQWMDGNGDGEAWEHVQGGMPAWKTKKAMARGSGISQGRSFSLNEYTDFVKAAEDEHARQEKEKLKKAQEGF